MCPLPEVPSPNAHEYEYGMTPPPPVHVNVTVWPTSTEVGSPPAVALSGLAVATLTVFDSDGEGYVPPAHGLHSSVVTM